MTLCRPKKTRPEPLDVDVLCRSESDAQALLAALATQRLNGARVTATAVHVRAAGEDIARVQDLVRAHAPEAEMIRRELSRYPSHAACIREAESGPIVKGLLAKASEDARFGRVRPNELEALRVLGAEQMAKIERALERARRTR